MLRLTCPESHIISTSRWCRCHPTLTAISTSIWFRAYLPCFGARRVAHGSHALEIWCMLPTDAPSSCAVPFLGGLMAFLLTNHAACCGIDSPSRYTSNSHDICSSSIPSACRGGPGPGRRSCCCWRYAAGCCCCSRGHWLALVIDTLRSNFAVIIWISTIAYAQSSFIMILISIYTDLQCCRTGCSGQGGGSRRSRCGGRRHAGRQIVPDTTPALLVGPASFIISHKCLICSIAANATTHGVMSLARVHTIHVAVTVGWVVCCYYDTPARNTTKVWPIGCCCSLLFEN